MSVEQIKYIFDNWNNLKWEEQNYNNFINYLKKTDLNNFDIELQQKIKELLNNEAEKNIVIIPNNNSQNQNIDIIVQSGELNNILKTNSKNNKLSIIFILIAILLIGIGYLIYNGTIDIPFMNNDKKEDSSKEANNNSNIIENSSLVKLKQGKTEKIINAELLYINDYKLTIPSELISIGYTVSIDNDVLTINAKDNSYKFVMLQLTDNYIQITEEDADNFYETKEYKVWDEKYYGSDNKSDDEYEELLKERDEIANKYYQDLGYTFKNTPDLDYNELNKIVSKYLLEGESSSSGSNGLFPGQEYYQYFPWGKRVSYAIPKYQKDSFFGEDTSDFSVYLETFHYYNSSTVSYEIGLWTF